MYIKYYVQWRFYRLIVNILYKTPSHNNENVLLLILLSYCFDAQGHNNNNLTSVKAFTDFIAQIDLNMCQNEYTSMIKNDI